MCADDIEIIKNELKKNVIQINSFEQVDVLLFNIQSNFIGRKFIAFNNSALKKYFLENSPYKIVNCNSSYERFCNDLMYHGDEVIFNNINYCNDFDILNILKNTNNLLIQ